MKEKKSKKTNKTVDLYEEFSNDRKNNITVER